MIAIILIQIKVGICGDTAYIQQGNFTRCTLRGIVSQ